MKYSKYELFLGLARIGLGWIFFWAFIDKVFGLGFTTASEAAWINGGSPTTGFLKFGTHGPFAEIFQSMAGSGLVDALFMVGLLLIGICLMLGVAVRFASYAGALLLLLMWLALLPPEHNPVIDEHVIYALILLVVAHAPSQPFSVRRINR
jgi:thiosulfate dehydrogenase [quinone] large subunit